MPEPGGPRPIGLEPEDEQKAERIAWANKTGGSLINQQLSGPYKEVVDAFDANQAVARQHLSKNREDYENSAINDAVDAKKTVDFGGKTYSPDHPEGVDQSEAPETDQQ